MQTTSSSFALTHLHAGYDGQTVISLPSLTLHAGERCLLKGPSGSGKTTVLHTISGILPPVGGSVMLNSRDIYSLTDSARDRYRGQNIGFIFQTLHLIKSLSVLDNVLVASYATSHRQNREQALALLERLGIADLAHRPATAISQGQAQRVAIARALLGSPPLILADEPTSSLDDTSCAQTIALLIELTQAANAILIVSSHDSRIQNSFSHILNLGDLS